MGPGAGFGEMALLTSQPRSATITAVEPGGLHAIASPAFLAAVTGGGDGVEEEGAKEGATERAK
ncbi:MAG: cyclic nucleotide-binding domain-containing protein [Alsobacter sp.]